LLLSYFASALVQQQEDYQVNNQEHQD